MSLATVRAWVPKGITRKHLLWAVAVFFVLQIYFVRELLAAELLFALAFAVLFAAAVVFYFVGAIGERGLDLAEQGVRAMGQSARWAYNGVEFLSKRSFRRPHSESVP